MFDTFPVRLAADADVENPRVMTGPVLKVINLEHPILKGYGTKANLSEVTNKPSCNTLNLIKVYPSSGDVVAVIEGMENSKKVTELGIVEGGSLFGGKVIYFAYDPGCTPNAWISTAGYLTGKYAL